MRDWGRRQSIQDKVAQAQSDGIRGVDRFVDPHSGNEGRAPQRLRQGLGQQPRGVHRHRESELQPERRVEPALGGNGRRALSGSPSFRRGRADRLRSDPRWRGSPSFRQDVRRRALGRRSPLRCPRGRWRARLSWRRVTPGPSDASSRRPLRRLRYERRPRRLGRPGPKATRTARLVGRSAVTRGWPLVEHRQLGRGLAGSALPPGARGGLGAGRLRSGGPIFPLLRRTRREDQRLQRRGAPTGRRHAEGRHPARRTHGAPARGRTPPREPHPRGAGTPDGHRRPRPFRPPTAPPRAAPGTARS